MGNRVGAVIVFGIGAFVLFGLLAFITNAIPSEGSFFLLVPVGTLVFDIALSIFGRTEASGDAAFLLGFLRETLGAEETGDTSS